LASFTPLPLARDGGIGDAKKIPTRRFYSEDSLTKLITGGQGIRSGLTFSPSTQKFK
jgi:hypothetical protein